MQAGDTGVRAITAISQASGTSGAIDFFGLLPIGFAGQNQVNNVNAAPYFSYPNVMWYAVGGDVIGFYGLNVVATCAAVVHLVGVGY